MKIFKIIVPLSCAILLCSCGTGTSQNEASSDSKKVAAMVESKESATKIYLKDYATMEFDGNDTVGRISKFGIDTEQMVIDNSTVFGGSSDEIILDVAEYIDTKTDISRYLSNGDTTELIVDDKYTKLEDKYNVNLITDGLEFTVSGLKELEEIDPFEKAELVCTEASKDSEDKSRLCSLSKEKYPSTKVYYKLDKEVAKVGETVTAEIYTKYTDGTTVEQTFAIEGYKPTRTKAEFTVE